MTSQGGEVRAGRTPGPSQVPGGGSDRSRPPVGPGRSAAGDPAPCLHRAGERGRRDPGGHRLRPARPEAGGPGDRRRSPAASPADAERPAGRRGGSSDPATAAAETPQADGRGDRAATPAPPPPGPDPAKVAAAEKALDAASGDRARADGRAADAARRMARAANQAALDALRARKLAFQVRDPSNRIAQAVARGGFIRGERDKLAKEVATLRSAPRPKSVSILSKSPVARPVADDEYHFELRHDRITFIDLDKLMKHHQGRRPDAHPDVRPRRGRSATRSGRSAPSRWPTSWRPRCRPTSTA